MITDQDILAAALVGFQTQLAQIEARIGQIKAQLGGAAPAAPAAAAAPAPRRAYKKKAAPVAAPVRKKRVLSAEARANMAAGQQRRWAERNKKLGK
jgi:hypothetical protein